MITTSVTNTYKFVGLSTETKPKGPAVGSIFEETDTGNTFFYNGKRWVKLAEEESGGGAFFVNFTVDDSSGENVYSADKTFAEVAAAIDAGKMIIGIYSGDGTDYYYYPLAEYSGDNFATFRGFTLGTDGFFEQFTLMISEDDTVTGEYVDCDLSTLIVE